MKLMKLNNEDLKALARSRTMRTKRSKFMWFAVGVVLIAWLVLDIIFAAYYYNCPRCSDNALNISNIIGFSISIALGIITVLLDVKQSNKLFDEIKKEYTNK